MFKRITKKIMENVVTGKIAIAIIDFLYMRRGEKEKK